MSLDIKGEPEAVRIATRWHYAKSIVIWICGTAVLCTLIVRCS